MGIDEQRSKVFAEAAKTRAAYPKTPIRYVILSEGDMHNLPEEEIQRCAKDFEAEARTASYAKENVLSAWDEIALLVKMSKTIVVDIQIPVQIGV